MRKMTENGCSLITLGFSSAAVVVRIVGKVGKVGTNGFSVKLFCWVSKL